jgi:hypothetical protein
MERTLAYEFGGFRFEPAEDRLTCGGYTVRLTPKAAQTLLALVKRPDTVVSKEELFAAVWPGVAVEENRRLAGTRGGHSRTATQRSEFGGGPGVRQDARADALSGVARRRGTCGRRGRCRQILPAPLKRHAIAFTAVRMSAPRTPPRFSLPEKTCRRTRCSMLPPRRSRAREPSSTTQPFRPARRRRGQLCACAHLPA